MPDQPQRYRDEQSPLLRHSSDHGDDDSHTVDFHKEDAENPKQWSKARKMGNVAIISLMAVLSPLASSMFTPGIHQIAEDLNSSKNEVIGATTGFVVMLGIGPLILAPLSETFGVGLANGGGTLSDMFESSERAGIFGWYLLGPLLGPALGPLFGGLIIEALGWRWVFWILTIVCMTNTALGFFFLKETYAPVILAWRCQKESSKNGGKFTYPGEDGRPMRTKLVSSIQRPLRILFTQPMVMVMALYQAIIFATMYSLFTNMQSIYGSEPYSFSTTQVGLLYVGPGVGFFIAAWFLVPRIDTIFNKMTADNNGESKPEFRLPLANVGAVVLPVTLFWFAWTVEYRAHIHWFVSILATVFFGLGQVLIFNTVQNYYIDAFSKYAASAIAAGAVFRSIVGGIVPLLAPKLFDSLGYGWGWSVFAFMTVALAPSPLLFMKYGEMIRKKFEISL